jgi:hypothetical protein
MYNNKILFNNMKLLVIQNELLTILNFNHLEYIIFIEKKTICNIYWLLKVTNGIKTEA